MDPNTQNQNVPQPTVVIQQPQTPQRDKLIEMVVPINRSGWSIAAGYFALFSFPILICAPIALVLGIIALVDLGKHPERAGRGRTWFAIIYSSLIMLLVVALLVRGIVNK